MSPDNPLLFEADLPEGFAYREDFISAGEAAALTARIGQLAFANFEMRGAIAKRRVAFFGTSSYGRTTGPVEPIPEFLLPVRARVARWAGVDDEAFAMALTNEYRPGAPIGWHRDAPPYGIVAGVSLLSACRMKFRPYVGPSAHLVSGQPPRKTTHELTLLPCSAYLITGASRSDYEHSIPAVTSLRYSVTFRTLRR